MRKALIAVLGLVFVGFLKWAFDHFLWDWFVQFIEVRWHLKEAALIASVSSYAFPILIVAACIAALYFLIRTDVFAAQQLASAQDTNRYMTAYEAIHYIADKSEFGNETRQYRGQQYVPVVGHTIPMKKNALLEAQSEFKRVAAFGVIKAIGRLDGAGEHVQIPDTYWMSAGLSPFSLGNPGISATIATVYNPDGIPTYGDVRIVRADVERAWPAQKTGWKGLLRWQRPSSV
jgi:hypothetical protein